MTTMIDMSYANSDSMPCCSPSECHYPIGFFLSPKQVKDLGIPDTVKPGAMMKIEATIKVTSVTNKENQTELYASVTEMCIDSEAKEEKETISSKMAKAYKGDQDGNE